MAQGYWSWPESAWVSDKIDWRDAGVITAGVDIGTTSTQAAIFADGALFGYANAYASPSFKDAADGIIAKACGDTGLEPKDIQRIVATGFGARNAAYASKTVDAVSCHAKGARFMFGPAVKTVVDLGGQGMAAIRLYDWDRVRDFMMNDKCATGFGRNIEMMAEMLQIPLPELGGMSLDVEHDPEPVSTTCYSFANPETIGLFRTGFREEKSTGNDVVAAYLFAIAWRALGVIGKLAPLDVGDISVEPGLAFTGGLAKNKGITARIERELKTTALSSEYDPQLAGAIGAALLA